MRSPEEVAATVRRFARQAGLLAVVGALLLVVSACEGGDEGAGAQGPRLRLGSAGLRNDLLVTDASTAAVTGRARSTDEVLLLATASDAGKGVRRVSVDGELQITCVPTSGTHIVRIRDPIHEEATASDPSALPARLAKQYALRVRVERDRCPAATRFTGLELRVHADADTGSGSLQTPEFVVESFGPDAVRIATFNFFNPGRHADAVFEQWGRTLVSQADVAFFQELPDERRAQLVATAAGLPYVAYFENTAIASRAPLRDLRRLNVEGSIIIAATTDLAGHPHTIVGSHFNDVRVRPYETSASRVKAAEELLALLPPAPGIVLAGGDFNAYSGIGPQVMPGGTDEIGLLRAAMTDIFTALGVPDDSHCSNQRIDYLFVRGSYTPTEYKACFPESSPSDHPFVWARLVAG
jgi:endonuclease/exonuclease/phosphatase family metal-dependent hydrolase